MGPKSCSLCSKLYLHYMAIDLRGHVKGDDTNMVDILNLRGHEKEMTDPSVSHLDLGDFVNQTSGQEKTTVEKSMRSKNCNIED